MKTIAIKGHKTRYKEVIEILEMLGGTNTLGLIGFIEDLYYYINNDNTIVHTFSLYKTANFTVEEFFERFPYKVGDKVQHKGAISCGTVYVIERMNWANTNIEYEIRPLYDYNHTGLVTVRAEDLQSFEEENMDKAVFDANTQCCDIMNRLIKKETTEENLTIQDIRDNNAEWLLNKLEEMSVKKVLQTISDLYDKLRKPKYPKTYVECCEILYPNENFQLIALPHKGHNGQKLFALQKLLVCRDTYWKIAGEQMGLGKPWEPDWSNLSVTSHEFIKINNGRFIYSSRVLVFPTSEICNTFYENFKNLIEQCKELL